MGTILRDLRHASRSLRKIPGFSAAAVLTLGLGIGANTAIFSIVDGLLLRPLPYKDPSSLVQLWNTYPPTIPQGPNSAGDFRDFRMQARTFSGMGAYIDTPRGLNLTGEGEPERLESRYMTSGLLPLLGIHPAAGRSFTPAEDNREGPLTILISYDLWQRRFGSDPGIVGRTLTLDRRGYMVVGVLPEQLRLAPTTDVWMPIGQYDAGPDPYRYHEFSIIGRLKPGARIEQAQVEITLLNRQEEQAFPDTHKNFGVLVTRMEDPSARKMRKALLVLFGAVALVLLVACANVVNLLLARNAAREKELALRVALGASRRRLLSQLLAESILLSVAGGALGIVLAEAGLRMLEALVPSDLASVRDAGLNSSMLAFTVAVSVASGIGCGLIPALQVLKRSVYNNLREGTRAMGGAGRHGMRRVLVISEIALAMIPLIGAGLFIRSFHRLLEVDPGFRHDHILVIEARTPELSLGEQSKLSVEQRIASLRRQSMEYDELMQRIRSLPGVKAAGGISVLPLGTAMRSASRFIVEGQPVPADGARPAAETRAVSPGYFAVLGIPLWMGRLLDAHDYGSQNIVINEAFAQKFWPAGDAIGKRINFCSLAPEPCWTTVVGVVGNVHQYGLEAGPTFDSYGTLGWMPYTLIRTASDPLTLAQPVIAEVHKFDSSLPVTHVMTLDNLFSESLSPRRFSTFLLGLFAGLALLLAAIGVYAVMNYSVRLRANEIGVRIALGAGPGNIWWLILGGWMRLVLVGIAFGFAGSFALTKVISNLLYGVTSTDPVTFGAVPLLLACVALIACYIPARRALRIDPMAALRLD